MIAAVLDEGFAGVQDDTVVQAHSETPSLVGDSVTFASEGI